MLFDIPYITDWSKIEKHRQQQVDQSNIIENENWIEFDSRIRTIVVLVPIKYGVYHKAENKSDGPYLITEFFLTKQLGFNAE